MMGDIGSDVKKVAQGGKFMAKRINPDAAAAQNSKSLIIECCKTSPYI